ncbi:MAG: radical SAM protein [Clostridia bacterium]|nr:radical SAM protein [Clostridia bacterium]
MKKYSCYELIIEVTRRCNMRCAHCLRGDAEDQDISFQVIDDTLRHFDQINTITFTGGEPSLNLQAIRHALTYCKRRKIPVGSFFIATNGLENVDGLIKVCDKWYDYTLFSEYHADKSQMIGHETIERLISIHNDAYEVTSAVALSSDPYHGEIPIANLYKLMSRKYFSDMKVHDFKHGVQARGRGRGLANSFYREPTTRLEFNDENSVELVYVTYAGNILADCDMEFVGMDDVSLGNVSDPTVFEKIYERQQRDDEEDD